MEAWRQNTAHAIGNLWRFCLWSQPAKHHGAELGDFPRAHPPPCFPLLSPVTPSSPFSNPPPVTQPAPNCPDSCRVLPSAQPRC